MKKIQVGHHRQYLKHKYPLMWALVDDRDYEYLNQYKWYPHFDKTINGYYVRSTLNGSARQDITMHRMLLNAVSGEIVDHINHNTLDNRRDNLRKVSKSQSAQNRRSTKTTSSQYKGVSWCKLTNKWKVELRKDKKYLYLGLFSDEKAAAIAYNTGAKQYHNEFASLNDV